MKDRIAFTAADRNAPFYRFPPGVSLLVILAAQTAIVWVPPTGAVGLSALLLLAAALARRPVHTVLLNAWPVLVLALFTALRSDSAGLTDRLTVFMRFCFMIVAADFYITSFSWQPALARLATTPLERRARDRQPATLRLRSRIAVSTATVALALWLAVLHIPGVITRLRARRDAARARGIPSRRLLAPAALSSLLTQLIADADTRAEAIAARGLLSEAPTSDTRHFRR